MEYPMYKYHLHNLKYENPLVLESKGLLNTILDEICKGIEEVALKTSNAQYSFYIDDRILFRMLTLSDNTLPETFTNVLLRELRKLFPDSRVLLIGCYIIIDWF